MVKVKKTRKEENFQKEKVRRSKLAGGIFVVVIILLLLLILFILVGLGVFDAPKQQQVFSIRDECSLVMGNIIHNVGDEGDCQIRCKNDCDIRGLEFISSQFNLGNNSCNSCDCYCK